MSTFKHFLVIGMVLLSSWSYGQFSLQGELRPRTEYRHGFQSLVGPDNDAAFFTSQRSRLNFAYQHPDVKFYISLQDVRVWGEVPQLNRSDLNFSLHEAWAEIPMGTAWAMKLGRQELVYDDARILGNVDWAQQGRSHDLALFKWSMGEGTQLHLGLAFNQESEKRTGTVYALPNNYKTMQFAWLNIKPGASSLSLLLLNNGLQHSLDKTLFSQTLGGRVSSPAGPLALAASAYLQTGKDVADRKMNAFYLAAEAGFKLSDSWSSRLGFEWLSGNNLIDNAIIFEDNKNKAFNPLYGTNHKFNGHMDYFFVGNHINDVGLRDAYAALDYKKEKWLAGISLHSFWADGTITRDNQEEKAYLGNELDLMLGYQINPSVALRMGYSQMFASPSMEILKGGSRKETQNWAWMMLIIKPRLFEN